jgi:uncharacterized protein
MLFGFWIGSGVGIAWLTVSPKVGHSSVTPSAYKMPFEKVEFSSPDGVHLAAWLIPARTGPSKGLIILCHGVDSAKEDMLDKALMFHDHGYSTLLYDARGRGESGGGRCTMGYREVDDLLAAVQFVRKRKELTGTHIGVFGESLGAAVALMGTPRCPQIEAVVAESAFACLDHALRNHFTKDLGWSGALFIPPVTWAGQIMIGRNVCDIAPRDEIKHISPRPILLIQDGNDRLCPPLETRELMRAAKEPKQLWTVPGADHIRAQETDPEEFETHVIGFFDQAFGNSKATAPK